MSLKRLIRALENGGAAFLNARGGYDIRRRADARNAIIGELGQADFLSLKQENRLKRLGDVNPARYIWHGPFVTPCMASSSSVEAFLCPTVETPKSLLEQSLYAMTDQAEAAILECAATWFQDDVNWQTQSGVIAGMNWQGLALGGRVDSSVTLKDPTDPFYSIAAIRRLEHLSASLSCGAYEQLFAIVIRDVTPQNFARLYSYPRHGAKTRAIDLLRRLSWVYEKELKPARKIDTP